METHRVMVIWAMATATSRLVTAMAMVTSVTETGTSSDLEEPTEA
jgi:hypothetical protein